MSDIVGKNEPLFEVPCNNCLHYLPEHESIGCMAFDNIPKNIIFGKLKHDKIIEGQKGEYIFTPK